jgi:hypothetical protein
MRGLVVACAAAVLLAALFASAGDDEDLGPPASSVAVAEGLVFSADDGDAVDVYFTRDTPTMGCMNVGGFFYGSTISCFDPDGAEGSYAVVIPTTREKPPIVVGVMPGDATAATVQAGPSRVRAETRGRWFLASLEPGALGSNNANTVTVAFDR